MSPYEKDRDSLFVGPPPDSMKNPIGHWYCDECECLAPKCNSKLYHFWRIKWIEEKE